MGHLVTVSENILYKHVLAQRPQHGFELSQFAKGTRPEQFIDENQILLIRNALRETFPAFKMEHGSLVISEERLQFLMLHEHLHYQAIVALIRQLTTK